jgi:hypothetical protein
LDKDQGSRQLSANSFSPIFHREQSIMKLKQLLQLARSKPRKRARPWIERLEHRDVPTTFTPTTFADGIGIGSLRDAILSANADSSTATDTIQLQAGTYSLTLVNTAGHNDNGHQGDLTITNKSHELIIMGKGSSGAGATIIDASALQDRLFQIVNPGITVSFENLVMEGGKAQDNGTNGALPGTTQAEGGAILSNGDNVTLSNVVLENNVALGGNGANGPLGANGGPMTNGGPGGPGSPGLNAAGGAVYAVGGTLSISGSTITKNEAIGGNGGNGGNGGDANSATANYHAGNGGAGGAGGAALGAGVFASGATLKISSGTVVDDNTALGGSGSMGGTGGAGSHLTVHQLGLGAAGGAGGNAQGGGIYAAGSPVSISGSAKITLNTVSGGAGGGGGNGQSSAGFKQADGGAGGTGGAGQGGGVYASGASLTIINARVDANYAVGGTAAGGGATQGHPGTGGAAQGGGIYAVGAMVKLQSAGVSSNTARGGAGLGGFNGLQPNAGAGQGGGLFVSGDSLSLSASTVNNNSAIGGAGGEGINGDPNDTIRAPGGTGGNGGAAQGGGIYADSVTITLSNQSSVNLNRLLAGPGGNGGNGATSAGKATYGGPGGSGGNGADAEGGGLFVSGGSFTLSGGSVVLSNSLLAGSGGNGGNGGTGATAGVHNLDWGAGGAGGSARGGGLYASGATIQIVNGEFNTEQVIGGAGGAGGHGSAAPSGHAGTGGAGGNGGGAQGGGIYATGGSVGFSSSQGDLNTIRAGSGGNGGHGGHGTRTFNLGAAVGGAAGAGGSASGGGLFVAATKLTFTSAQTSSNSAYGGGGGLGGNSQAGGAGGNASGGGLFASGSTVIISGSNVHSNHVYAGNGGTGGIGAPTLGSAGGAGGVAQGGGLSESGGSLTITNSTFKFNQVFGGAGGAGGLGYTAASFGGPGGAGGSGGAAQGGGLFCSLTTVSLSTSTVSDAAVGGTGGNGGHGGNGFSTAGNGDNGGNGGVAQGAGVYASGGKLTITNATIALSMAQGGNGGAGGHGGSNANPFSFGGNGGNGGNGAAANGAGIFFGAGTLSLTNATIASNNAKLSTGGAGGAPGVGGAGHGIVGSPGAAQSGAGGGAFVASGTTVNAINTLFGANQAGSAPDFSGKFTTATHNFLEDGTGSNLPPGTPDSTGNIVGTSAHPINPLLGTLANNGGPTETMALLAGSPCLNAGTSSGAPAADQRGVARDTPPDIGAFELETTGQAPVLPHTVVQLETRGAADLSNAVGFPSDLSLRIAALDAVLAEWNWPHPRRSRWHQVPLP